MAQTTGTWSIGIWLAQDGQAIQYYTVAPLTTFNGWSVLEYAISDTGCICFTGDIPEGGSTDELRIILYVTAENIGYCSWQCAIEEPTSTVPPPAGDSFSPFATSSAVTEQIGPAVHRVVLYINEHHNWRTDGTGYFRLKVDRVFDAGDTYDGDAYLLAVELRCIGI